MRETKTIKIFGEPHCVYCGNPACTDLIEETDINSRSYYVYTTHSCDCKLAEYELFLKKEYEKILGAIPKLTRRQITEKILNEN